MDGRNPAPPKKPWNSPVNSNTRSGFNHGFQAVRNGLRPSTLWIHPSLYPRGQSGPASGRRTCGWSRGLAHRSAGATSGSTILGCRSICLGGSAPRVFSLFWVFNANREENHYVEEKPQLFGRISRETRNKKKSVAILGGLSSPRSLSYKSTGRAFVVSRRRRFPVKPTGERKNAYYEIMHG